MILLTGGAGFIGSHTMRALLDRGEKVMVLDNLISGYRENIPSDVDLVVGDIADSALVTNIIKKYNIDTVMHFAAFLIVPESVEKPLKYYDNNFIGSFNFIKTCAENGVRNFIFSSTAAVYGTPEHNPVDEQALTIPESPYGRSKLMIEWLLEDIAKVSQLKFGILRYFNVAGARHDGSLGNRNEAHHLLAACCRAALGEQPNLQVFGDDYPTADGTCIRDYIHIDDLADIHILVMEYLRNGGHSQTFNCGYGHGFSVKEVINAFNQANGVELSVEYVGRRSGDPVSTYSNPEKVKKMLDWKPKYDDIITICRDAYNWENKKKGTL